MLCAADYVVEQVAMRAAALMISLAASRRRVSTWSFMRLQVVGEAERQDGTVNVRTRDELVRDNALLESGLLQPV